MERFAKVLICLHAFRLDRRGRDHGKIAAMTDCSFQHGERTRPGGERAGIRKNRSRVTQMR